MVRKSYLNKAVFKVCETGRCVGYLRCSAVCRGPHIPCLPTVGFTCVWEHLSWNPSFREEVRSILSTQEVLRGKTANSLKRSSPTSALEIHWIKKLPAVAPRGRKLLFGIRLEAGYSLQGMMTF